MLDVGTREERVKGWDGMERGWDGDGNGDLVFVGAMGMGRERKGRWKHVMGDELAFHSGKGHTLIERARAVVFVQRYSWVLTDVQLCTHQHSIPCVLVPRVDYLPR